MAKYTGREQDGADLYYYRNRYYKPSLGRFISEDPIGLAGGPNTYTYVYSNPLRWIDPSALTGSEGATDRQGNLGPLLGYIIDKMLPGEGAGNDAVGGDESREAKAKQIKNKCIEECSPILERPKRYPGDDSPTWDFHKCVNECMERERKDCR